MTRWSFRGGILNLQRKHSNLELPRGRLMTRRCVGPQVWSDLDHVEITRRTAHSVKHRDHESADAFEAHSRRSARIELLQERVPWLGNHVTAGHTTSLSHRGPSAGSSALRPGDACYINIDEGYSSRRLKTVQANVACSGKSLGGISAVPRLPYVSPMSPRVADSQPLNSTEI